MANEKITEALGVAINSALQDVNTCILVQVVAVNGNRVDLQPLILGKVRDNEGNVTDEKLPVILDVPVLALNAGGFSVHTPTKVGDQGLALVSQRDVRNWKPTQTVSTQKSLRRFNMNDCFYLGAVLPASANSVEDGVYVYNDAGLFFSVKSDKVETNMDIHCQNVFCANITSTGSMTANSGTVTTGNLVTPSADFNSHVHSGVATGPNTTGGPQ